jgi:hypothetical protein
MGAAKMTKVFIVILNFNGKEYILDCLKTVRNKEVEIVVVDNGSTDGSLQSINSLKWGNLKIIKNKRNLGFAGGCNVGIRYALEKDAEAILLLNPDTIVSKGFLRPLLENPADIIGPVIKFKRGGEWVYDFGGKVNLWLGRSYHLEERARTKVRYYKFPDYVSGCAMLIKRPVFEKIGLLDERYFLYEEDVDFCLKARKAGFKVAVEPRSIIVHKLTEGKKKPLKQHFSHLKSNFIFINHWIPVYKRPLAYIYLLLLLFKVLIERV